MGTATIAGEVLASLLLPISAIWLPWGERPTAWLLSLWHSRVIDPGLCSLPAVSVHSVWLSSRCWNRAVRWLPVSPCACNQRRALKFETRSNSWRASGGAAVASLRPYWLLNYGPCLVKYGPCLRNASCEPAIG